MILMTNRRRHSMPDYADEEDDTKEHSKFSQDGMLLEWRHSEWSFCSKSCGKDGTQVV